MALGASAGIFQTMGDKMGNATGGLMDRKDKQPAMALNSMWLEFTFTAPGGAQTTHRRYLVAPRSDHNSDATQLLWPLLTNHTYQVNAGGQPLDYLADRYLATGISNQAWLAATIGKFREPAKPMTEPTTDIPADFPVLAQYRFMDDNPFAETGVISFRATPSLVGLRRGFRDADTVVRRCRYCRQSYRAFARDRQRPAAGAIGGPGPRGVGYGPGKRSAESLVGGCRRFQQYGGGIQTG